MLVHVLADKCCIGSQDWRVDKILILMDVALGGFTWCFLNALGFRVFEKNILCIILFNGHMTFWDRQGRIYYSHFADEKMEAQRS